MAITYYEFKDEKSNKFWEIEIKGKTVTVRFGRIGTDGQTTVKAFPNASDASAHASKVTAEKTKKGYKKAKRPVSSEAKATGAKKKASAKQPSTKRASNKAKAKVPTARKPGPTSQSELVTWLKEPGRSGAELASVVGRFTRTDRLIAAHGDAPPALLVKLSHSDDRNIRARVATNPNTPAADYVRLGQQFPKEFLANPLLDLLLLEDPAWARQLPEALLVQVLKREGCPAEFLIWAAAQSSEKVQLAVAMNAKVPEAALEQLRRSKHKKVRESVARESVSDPEKQFREAVRERLAALTPEEAVEAWAKKDIGLAQFAVLSHKAKIAVSRMIDRYSHLVRCALASNPAVPTAVLEELSKDIKSEVRLAVAKNPQTPRKVLRRLQKDYGDPGREVTASIHWAARTGRSYLVPKGKKARGSRPASDDKQARKGLEDLIKSPDVQVRIELAKDPGTPADILAALARQEFAEQERRLELLKQPRDLPWFLTHVSGAPPEVRQAVERNDYLCYCGKDPNRAVLSRRPLAVVLALASGPFVTPDRIARVSGSSDWLVRSAVARNRGTPAQLREKLKRDGHPLVRALASAVELPAKTPTTGASSKGLDAGRVSSELSKLLLGPSGRDLRSSLAKSDECPPPVRVGLAKDEDPQVRKMVVYCARTPETLLSTLAKDKSTEVRGAVAGCDRTPAAILAVLAKDESVEVRETVASCERTPVAMLAVLAKDENAKVRLSAVRNSKLPKASREAAIKDKAVSVADAAAKSSSERLTILERQARSASSSTRQKVAEDPDVTEALLEKLAKDRDRNVRWAVANNPKTPQACLERLAKDTDRDVRMAVVNNPKTSHELFLATLEKLAKDSKQDVRHAVAKNRRTPLHILESLGRQYDAHICLSIARNPNASIALRDVMWRQVAEDFGCKWFIGCLRNHGDIPTFVLDIRAKDPDRKVREVVAEKPETPPAALELLAKDPDEHVRSGVAKNPKTPPALLEFLANDSYSYTRGKVASHSKTPPARLELLAKDEDEYVRSYVARNVEAPPAALEWLAKDPYDPVRWGVAGNPKTPLAALELLAKDPDESVRGGVARHSRTSLALLELLAEDPDKGVRTRVASHSRTPPALLERLARDATRDVRTEVAMHPDTPPAVLASLAKDRVREIRQKVSERLKKS